MQGTKRKNRKTVDMSLFIRAKLRLIESLEKMFLNLLSLWNFAEARRNLIDLMDINLQVPFMTQSDTQEKRRINIDFDFNFDFSTSSQLLVDFFTK